MKHFAFMCMLCVTALVLGTLANTIGPHRIPWSQNWSGQVLAAVEEAGFATIDAAAALEITEAGGRMILDARPQEDYDNGHLPGALSLSLKSFDDAFPAVQGLIFPEDPLVVYCSGLSCDEALELAKRLQEMGFEEIEIFVGGMEAWLEAEYPVE